MKIGAETIFNSILHGAALIYKRKSFRAAWESVEFWLQISNIVSYPTAKPFPCHQTLN